MPAIRRTADLAFIHARVAVFLDGCFWHGCPEHHRPSRLNSDFWTAKIEGTRARDAETDQLLSEAGWMVLRVWEHEDPAVAADSIAREIEKRTSRRKQTDRARPE